MNRPCNYHEECINTPGSYKCQLIDNLCGQGYRIDKKTGFCIGLLSLSLISKQSESKDNKKKTLDFFV